jgi:hypothetical protein
VTSTDGVTWTDHGLIRDDPDWPLCNIIEGLAWADGQWYAVCGDWYGQARIYRSSDTLTWAEHALVGAPDDLGGHLFLSWHEGTFAVYGDTQRSFTSPDGLEWTELLGVQRATWCEGAYRSESDCYGSSWFDGAYFRTQWPDRIERSPDGIDWETVYTDPEQNSLYQPRAIAQGFIPSE